MKNMQSWGFIPRYSHQTSIPQPLSPREKGEKKLLRISRRKKSLSPHSGPYGREGFRERYYKCTFENLTPDQLATMWSHRQIVVPSGERDLGCGVSTSAHQIISTSSPIFKSSNNYHILPIAIGIILSVHHG